MLHAQHKWKVNDEISLFAQSWNPDDKPKAVIVLVHGLGEHSGRYNWWATKFTEHGYSLLAFDLRGHGKSDGKRGSVTSVKTFLKDIHFIIEKSESIYNNVPKIIYGHSMGGNLVLYYAIKKKLSVKGIIVTSPWLRLTFDPSVLKVFFGKLVSLFFPNFITSSDLIAENLSHDSEVVVNYKNDPLVHDKITANLFFDIQKKGELILKNKYKLNLPLLLMHGEKDNITSHKASRRFASNTSYLTHYKQWDGMFHELHNETCKEEVFVYILNWLSVILKKND